MHAPPPTFNSLDSRQRARLIRSTRKLADVLGSTPQLVDSPDQRKPQPRRDRKRRQGSIFEFAPPSEPFRYDYTYASSSASSSASDLLLPRPSLDSDSGLSTHALPPMLPTPDSFSRHVREKSKNSNPTRAPLPTPLVLRLNAVPLPPSDPRVHLPPTPDTAIPLKSATLAAPALPTTPTTPRTPPTPTATETRRKRLAKLKRTLGENVPPELIMPFRSLRAPRPSPAPSPVEPQPQPHHTHTPRPLVVEKPVVNPRKDNSRRRSLSVDFAAMSPPPPPPPPPKTPSRDFFTAACRHGRSPSHAYHAPQTHSQSSSRTQSPERTDSTERRSSRVWVTENATWTGEWNRRDIREVQHHLRTLKLR